MTFFSNSNTLKAFIVSKMTYPTTLLDNNRKYAVYTGGNNNGIYCSLEMIGDPTTLTPSSQRSDHFCPSYSINNDIAYIQVVI